MVRVLAVRRYKSAPTPTPRELELGNRAMSKQASKARRALEVTIVFEPSRLAADYLAEAYAQIIPLRIRSTQLEKDERDLSTVTLAEAEWRQQA